MWVTNVLKKNNKILPDMPFTGKELGLKLLKESKLDNVLIESIHQADHYNPIEKKVRISQDKLNKKSITSIAVVAHEIGHAIQDKENYKPLLLRQKLIEKTIIFQRYVPKENMRQCRSVLRAAAFTYLAKSIVSIFRLKVILFSFINILKSIIRR